jgi:hypothetical protein
MFDRADDADASAGGLEPPRRPQQAAMNLRRFVAYTLVGLALGGVVGLFILRQANYDPTPTLTSELFEAAHEHWKAAGPKDYDIEVRVTGPQAAVYRAEVRDGEPIAAWRNGQPLASRRTFGTWSVVGMFATISRDVEALERAAAKGAPPPLILRAEFDTQYSYPARYRRIDNGSRKGGDAIAVTWDVVEFRRADSRLKNTSAESP